MPTLFQTANRPGAAGNQGRQERRSHGASTRRKVQVGPPALQLPPHLPFPTPHRPVRVPSSASAQTCACALITASAQLCAPSLVHLCRPLSLSLSLSLSLALSLSLVQCRVRMWMHMVLCAPPKRVSMLAATCECGVVLNVGAAVGCCTARCRCGGVAGTRSGRVCCAVPAMRLVGSWCGVVCTEHGVLTR